jgi:phenylacetic acid degradation operon negative regulatory protein
MLHFVIAMIKQRTNRQDDRVVDDRTVAGIVDDGGLRPLSPRSVVLSMLLGQHPPAMAVGRLLEFTSLFGIADGTVRTALSRLVAAGDLHADDGVYRLSDRLLARQAEQDVGRALTPLAWDGDWWFVVALADRRSVAERRTFRARAVGARLGELRPDIWVRPTNVAVDLDLPDVLVTRGPLVTGDAGDLVARLWDLDALDERARHLIRPLDDVLADLRPPHAERGIPAAFTALAAAQRYLRTEPRLPPALSERPHADELRQRYAAVARAFQSALDAFVE